MVRLATGPPLVCNVLMLRRQLLQSLLAAPVRPRTISEDDSANTKLSHRINAGSVTDDDLLFLQQIGLRWARLEFGEGDISLDLLRAAQQRFARFGMRIHSGVHYAYRSKKVQLGLPGRDQDIETYCRFLRDLGKLGIPVASYDFHPANTYTTAMVERRGYTAREFDLETFRSKVEKQAFEREYSADEIWAAYTYFMKAVLPAAEKAGVTLALHPDDPPLAKMNGVAKLFTHYDGYARAEKIAGGSNHWGLTFCVGTWSEGGDKMGKDVFDMIRDFGGRGKIFEVHFRNVTGPLPHFVETFPDDGYLDMYQVMKALRQVASAAPPSPTTSPNSPGDTGLLRAGHRVLHRLHARSAAAGQRGSRLKPAWLFGREHLAQIAQQELLHRLLGAFVPLRRAPEGMFGPRGGEEFDRGSGVLELARHYFGLAVGDVLVRGAVQDEHGGGAGGGVKNRRRLAAQVRLLRTGSTHELRGARGRAQSVGEVEHGIEGGDHADGGRELAAAAVAFESAIAVGEAEHCGEVAAGGASHRSDALGVHAIFGGMGAHPTDRRLGVVQGRRIRRLARDAILDGESGHAERGHVRGLPSQLLAVAAAPAAAVKEDHGREGAAAFRQIKIGPEVDAVRAGPHEAVHHLDFRRAAEQRHEQQRAQAAHVRSPAARLPAVAGCRRRWSPARSWRC